jgi:hypothetical protein
MIDSKGRRKNFMQLDSMIPLKTNLALSEANIEREKLLLVRERELSTTLSQLKEEYVRELHTLIGVEKLDDYLQFRQRIKERMAEASMIFPATAEGEASEQQYRRHLLTEGQDFIQNLGVNTESVKALQRDFRSQAQLAVDKAMDIGQDSGEILMPVTPDFSGLGISPTDAWQTPPYDGEWGTWSWTKTRGSVSVSHDEDRTTGKVYCYSYISLNGADDRDYSYSNGYSELQFLYRMPKAGLVKARIYLQAVDVEYSGYLNNEPGWSDASIRQNSKVYLQVAPAGGSWGVRREADLYNYTRGDNDGSWSRVAASPSSWRTPTLVSTDGYAANQYVYVAVGIHDFNYRWVNDYSGWQRMRSHWLIPYVYVTAST